MDQNLLNLAKEIPMYAGGIKKYIKGNPEAVLMVEFIDTDQNVYEKKIKDLEYLVLNQNKKNQFSFFTDLSEQKEVFEIRKAGLNILMSMKGDKKPVAFIEDCAVSLQQPQYSRNCLALLTLLCQKGPFYKLPFASNHQLVQQQFFP